MQMISIEKAESSNKRFVNTQSWPLLSSFFEIPHKTSREEDMFEIPRDLISSSQYKDK